VSLGASRGSPHPELKPARDLAPAVHGSALARGSVKVSVTDSSGFAIERQSLGVPAATRRRASATVCDEGGESCDIRFVTCDRGDADDELSLSRGE
jgi:hypothetical protein